MGARARFEPRRVLASGAGPMGLLAALVGTRRRLDVHVLDRVTDGLKPSLVAESLRLLSALSGLVGATVRALGRLLWHGQDADGVRTVLVGASIMGSNTRCA